MPLGIPLGYERKHSQPCFHRKILGHVSVIANTSLVNANASHSLLGTDVAAAEAFEYVAAISDFCKTTSILP